jgi:hypothetical protein
VQKKRRYACGKLVLQDGRHRMHRNYGGAAFDFEGGRDPMPQRNSSNVVSATVVSRNFPSFAGI